MKKPFVLFDFDGVIADSFKIAFEINKMICPVLTMDSYKKRFEGNINDWQDPVKSHSDECRHDYDFNTEYVPIFQKKATLFAGMRESITELEKHYSLIIISSTVTSPIQEFLEKYQLLSPFTEVMGNDVHKSKVEKIKMVFEKYGATSQDCVFITDTLGDMDEAEKTGVGAIGVTWGFQTSDTLKRGNPFRLIEKPSDLPNAVSEYFQQQTS